MTAPEQHRFADGGAIPNSRLPVLVYHGVPGIGTPVSYTHLTLPTKA